MDLHKKSDTPAAGTAGLKVGARGDDGTSPFNGLIDEARLTASVLYTGPSFTVEKQLSALSATKGLWKFDGNTTADSSTSGNNGILAGGAGFSSNVPTSTCVSAVAIAPSLMSDTVWVEDGLPAGVTTDGNWRWDTRQKASGSQSHMDTLSDGRHQHYFQNAPTPLVINTGDVLVCYVLIDACKPPQEIMLQWLDPVAGWEHRAFWGADLIPVGTLGTPSKRYMGVLPLGGQWVRLEVPASLVGLEGSSVTGMAFTMYGGQAWFDRAGKR